MRRPLLRGLAVIAIGALLAACGGDDPEPTGLDSPEVTTTTTPPPPSVDTTTSTTLATGSTTTTRRSGSVGTTTTVKAAPGAAVITPPSPGRYSYTTTGSSTLGTTVTPFPGVTTLAVDPPTGTTQHSIRNLKDANGMGSSTDYVLDYRADGVYLVRATVNFTSGALTNDIPLNPAAPVMFIPTGATAGTHLEVDLPVTGTGPARLVIDVLREEAVSVGGQSVNAIVVRGVVTLPPGSVTGTQDLTLWFDRQSRLVVKESSRTDASALGGLARFTSSHEATLQNPNA